MSTRNDDCIKVIVRCRPLSSKEISKNNTKIVEINKNENSVIVRSPNSNFNVSGDKQKAIEHRYTYDGVFDDDSTQDEVFEQFIRPLVSSVLEGFNVTIFAYGQTGSGKTFTMSGTNDKPGVLPHVFTELFDRINTTETEAAKNGNEIQFLLRASFLELFKENIRDLLVKKPPTGLANVSAEVIGLEKIDPCKLEMKLNKHGNYIVNGLQEFSVKRAEDLLKILEIGNGERSVATTEMNDTSSRSHSIFTITVESSETIDGKNVIRVGKFNLVDLAGSERAERTKTSGEQFKIGILINKSLTTLNKVIKGLVKGDPYISFRESVLTHLLQDSLGGNTKTLMIAAISPASSNYDETLGTLRYADQAKQIKNKPKVNEDPKDAQIREMRDKIKELEEKLKLLENGKDPDAPVIIEYEYEYEYQYTDNDDDINSTGQTQADVVENGKRSKSSKKSKTPRQHQKTRKRKNRKHIKENGSGPEDSQIGESLTESGADHVKIEESIKKASEEAKGHDASTDAAKQQILELKNQMLVYKNQLVVKPEQWKSKNEKLEKDLAEATEKLNEQRAKERDLKLKLALDIQKEKRVTTKIESQQATCDMLEKEVDALRKEILELRQNLSVVKEKQQEETDELASEISEINRKQREKAFLVDLFIPPEEERKLRTLAIWDEEYNCWKRRFFDPREKVLEALGTQVAYPVFETKPKVSAARLAMMQPEVNTRYLTRNVMALCVDLPENGLLVNNVGYEDYIEGQNDYN